MKSGWSSFFPCSNCGSQNVTGAGYCGNCGVNLHYNCPECQGWVDATSSNCPNCRVKLDWPAGDFRAKPPSAVMLLLLGIVLLAIGGVYLIANNSDSANAVSHKTVNATSSTPASNPWPEINAAQPLIPYQYNPPSIDNTDTADYPGYSPASASNRDTAFHDPVIIIPANTPPVTETGMNSPQGRSYLDTVYPTWGHCSGGRCRSITQ
jgi:hypothetical protein